MSLADAVTPDVSQRGEPRHPAHRPSGASKAHGDTPSYRWFVLAGGSLIASAVLMLVTAQQEDVFTAVCAIVNLVLTGGCTWLALRRNPVSGTVLAAYLLPMGVQVALSTLYFCYFNPRFYIFIQQEKLSFLSMNWRFQLAASVYVVALSAMWFLFSPRGARGSSSRSYRAWSEAANAVCMPAFGAFAVIVMALLALRLVNIDEESYGGYFVFGIFRYCLGLPILCGATWRRRSWRDRAVIIGLLLANAGLNMVTNNRSFGFFPILYFGFGVLLLSDISATKKMQSLAVVIGLFLAVMIFGDLGRQLKMDIWRGGLDSLAERVEKLSQSTDALAETQERVGDKIFTRLFTLGGFQTVTFMPETVSYKPFFLPQYLLEVTSQGFLPRALATRIFIPVYEEKSTLIAFGYRLVHKRHSVERYCIGAAWEMGGFPAELGVGMLTGLILVAFVRLLEAVYAIAPQFAAVLLAVGIDRAVGATPEGVPSMLHDMVYSFPVGFCIYALVRVMGNVPPFRQTRARGVPSRDLSPRSVAMAPPA